MGHSLAVDFSTWDVRTGQDRQDGQDKLEVWKEVRPSCLSISEMNGFEDYEIFDFDFDFDDIK